MSRFLYSLGIWCADNAKKVVAIWLALLIGFGVLAGVVGQSLTNKITISGTSFQEVLDDLAVSIPEASGGTGMMVISSDDGEFSDDQIASVDKAEEQWNELPQVRQVVNPFTSREQQQESAEQLESAPQELAQGEKELEQGEAQLAASKEQLDQAKQQLEAGEAQLEPAREQLKQLKENDGPQAAIAQLEAQIAAGEERLKPAREQYEAGLAQWEKGRAELDGARAELEQGKEELQAGRQLGEQLENVKFVSDDDKHALVQLQFREEAQSLTPEEREEITEIGDGLEDSGITVNYGTEIVAEISLLGPGEVLGLMVSAVVLMIMLGTVLAAGLPLVAALTGVGVGLLAAISATAFIEMNSLTPSLALMLGLAVGIDYTLFIVNRHREQVLEGMALRKSVGLATGTAGSAVIFAGLTVVIALAALVLSGIGLLAQMGVVAAATVAVAVVLAVTLTPALLSLLGTKVAPRKAWRRHGYMTPGGERTLKTTLTEKHDHDSWIIRTITKFWWVAIAGVLAFVAIMAIPAADIRLGLPDGSAEPKGTTAHTAYELIAEEFGPGANGPMVAMATFDEPRESEVITQAEIVERLADIDGIDAVLPFGVSEDMRTFAFQVVAEGGPADEITEDAVHNLFDAKDSLREQFGADFGFAGMTVANIEISDILADALPKYLGVVVGLSLIILMIVFRSVIVPLIATLGFLLSVGAAFGATVAVYQWGWLGDVFSVATPGPVMSFAPIIVIGVLFGLAMDYQMFLVSGMRESYMHGRPARKAVKRGFDHGAKVVTAAAIIMSSVFGGFVFAHLTMVRPIGFGLAVGVLVDAVLVRMIFTPAIMHALGEKAWWIPRWLDKIVPNVDVEGTGLAEELKEKHQVTPGTTTDAADHRSARSES